MRGTRALVTSLVSCAAAPAGPAGPPPGRRPLPRRRVPRNAFGRWGRRGRGAREVAEQRRAAACRGPSPPMKTAEPVPTRAPCARRAGHALEPLAGCSAGFRRRRSGTSAGPARSAERVRWWARCRRGARVRGTGCPAGRARSAERGLPTAPRSHVARHAVGWTGRGRAHRTRCRRPPDPAERASRDPLDCMTRSRAVPSTFSGTRGPAPRAFRGTRVGIRDSGLGEPPAIRARSAERARPSGTRASMTRASAGTASAPSAGPRPAPAPRPGRPRRHRGRSTRTSAGSGPRHPGAGRTRARSAERVPTSGHTLTRRAPNLPPDPPRRAARSSSHAVGPSPTAPAAAAPSGTCSAVADRSSGAAAPPVVDRPSDRIGALRRNRCGRCGERGGSRSCRDRSSW